MFRAAVLELTPVPPIAPHMALETMRSNLLAAEQLVSQASAAGAAIVVLPEYGLSTPCMRTRDEAMWFVEELGEPDRRDYCAESKGEGIARDIACLARKYAVAIAANIGDLVNCRWGLQFYVCPWDGHFLFNTNVLFDREGRFIAKYWKNHMFLEPYFDSPPKSFSQYYKPATMNLTDVYGNFHSVRVGMMICYDIMFYEPQSQISSEGIDIMIFSSWWINTPPLLTALQVQEAWSISNPSVTLLAASAGNSWRFSGSGIYSNGMPIASRWNANQSFLLLGEFSIQKESSSIFLDNYHIDIPVLYPQEQKFKSSVISKETLLISKRYTESIYIGRIKCRLSLENFSIKSNFSGNFVLWATDAYNMRTSENYSGCGLTFCPADAQAEHCISLGQIDSANLKERLIGADINLLKIRIVSAFLSERKFLKFPIASLSNGNSIQANQHRSQFDCFDWKCVFETRQVGRSNQNNSISLMNFAILFREE
jgi:predicted amidohydrolase